MADPGVKGGRPPLPVEERLEVTFTIRFTEREADAIYSAATRHGVGAVPLLRQLIRQVLRSQGHATS